MGVSWRFCRKSFKTFRTDNFERHLEKCQGKKFKNINYPCMICNKDFSTITEHKQHIKMHNIPKAKLPKEYNCHICEKKLSSKQMLNMRIDKIHTIKNEKGFILVEEKQDFSCQICKKDFKTSFSLKRHKLAVL